MKLLRSLRNGEADQIENVILKCNFCRLVCVLCTYCNILELSWFEQFEDSYWKEKKMVTLSISCNSLTRLQNVTFTKTAATKTEKKKELHSVQINDGLWGSSL